MTGQDVLVSTDGLSLPAVVILLVPPPHDAAGLLPLAVLVTAVVAVFGVLRWAAYTVGRRTDEAPREPPPLS